MTLAIKRLPYHSHKLDLSKQENCDPKFRAISPSGKLPVLKDKAVVVRESQAIMFYLDRAYPLEPLYGETPAEAGAVMQEICEQQSYAEPTLSLLLGALLFNRPAAPEDVVRGADRFEALLGELNAKLAATGWLASDRLTAADINLYPLVRSVAECLSTARAADLGLTSPKVATFPSLLSWMQRLEPFAQAE